MQLLTVQFTINDIHGDDYLSPCAGADEDSTADTEVYQGDQNTSANDTSTKVYLPTDLALVQREDKIILCSAYGQFTLATSARRWPATLLSDSKQDRIHGHHIKRQSEALQDNAVTQIFLKASNAIDNCEGLSMAIDEKSVRPLERFMTIYYIYKLENVVCDADCTNIWCNKNAKIAYVGMATAVRPLQHFSAASNTGLLSHQLQASQAEVFLEIVGYAVASGDPQDFRDSGEDPFVVPTDLSTDCRSTSMCASTDAHDSRR